MVTALQAFTHLYRLFTSDYFPGHYHAQQAMLNRSLELVCGIILLISPNIVAQGEGTAGSHSAKSTSHTGPNTATGQDDVLPRVPFPRYDDGLEALPARKKLQLESAGQIKVFYQFHFTDHLKDSGITFVQHAVPYASDQYMQVHYDHGTGLAAADVDGDGLYDLYFVNQLGGNELWKNLGNGKFENITEQAGVGLKDRVSVAASFADVDNSGHEDLYVTTVNQGNVLFENDGHGNFKDITQEAGLGLIAHSSGSVFFDYDNDGLVSICWFATSVCIPAMKKDPTENMLD